MHFGLANFPVAYCGLKIITSLSLRFPDFQRVYCVYIAPDEQTIKTHAERGEFPANSIAEIKTMIDPTTAENS